MDEVPASPCDSKFSARFDQHSASVDEAYQAYDELRSKCPVAHSNLHGGYYMLVRHADVRKAAIDWQTYSSAKGVSLPPERDRPALPAIENDPPEHAVWRKLYTDSIVPAALRVMEPRMERIADELIDSFAAAGSCDLVRDYCEPLPVLGICAVLGLTGREPEEIRRLALAASSGGEDQPHIVARLGQFILGEIHARRKDPRDDYLTKIAMTEIDGRVIDDQQMALFMVGFLIAGHETTSSALTGLLFNVLSRPDLRQRLLDDEKAMSAAIEEAVRLTSPFHGFSRTTTRAVEVEGTTIPEDQVVRLCFAAANRDPAVFTHPQEFDIDRPSNPHLGFGAGRHVCAGAPFARLEMRTALRRLLKRLPDIVLTDNHLDWRFAGGLMTIPNRLQATFG